MASNDTRMGRLQRRLIEKIIKATHRPNHRLASTSRMRTAISPWRWQLWTACSRTGYPGLLGLISMVASARGIWLCACVRYRPGCGYVCPLLWVCRSRKARPNWFFFSKRWEQLNLNRSLKFRSGGLITLFLGYKCGTKIKLVKRWGAEVSSLQWWVW